MNQAIEDVKVPDIKQAFPLDGEYTFRFKTKVGNSKAWMDVKDDAKIPLSDGKIVMKVSRISWESIRYCLTKILMWKQDKGGRQRVVQDRALEEVKSPSSDSSGAQKARAHAAPKQSNNFGFDVI